MGYCPTSFSFYCAAPRPPLLSFPTRRSSDLFGFILLSYFVIVGTSNAVNLTDGLDGLAIMPAVMVAGGLIASPSRDRKSTRLNSSHITISYAVFCLKEKTHVGSSHSTYHAGG